MNRILYYSIIAFAALSLSACNNEEYHIPQAESNIMLSANISATSATRSTANAYTSTSADGMTAAVWFSMECGKYPYNANPVEPTYIPHHTTVTYSDESPTPVYVNPETKQPPLAYPITGDALNVYCVGFYPSTSWSVTADGSKASHSIDGSTDIMFADQIAGTWDKPFAAQRYKHLLTWIKLEASASQIEAPTQWGNIKKIEIVNSHSQVNIAFAGQTGTASTASYSGDENTITLFEGDTPISTVVSDMGSCLCTPAPTIKLAVTTERMGRKEVEVTLKDKNQQPLTSYTQAIGKEFIISLYFSALEDIDGACNLVPWNEQNMDLIGEAN